MRFRADAFLAVLILAGCSSSSVGVSPPQSQPQSSCSAAASASAVQGQRFLYAADGGSIAVIRLQDGAVVRRIESGIRKPSALAVDYAGNLYVANIHTVTVYPPERVTPSLTIADGIDRPTALAVDCSGDVFVANSDGFVGAFAPGRSVRSYRIPTGANGATTLALDPSGNLYVADGAADFVAVYGAGSASRVRLIRDGVRHPVALTFDPSGNLYVANPGFVLHGVSHEGGVTVYKPGSGVAWYRTSGTPSPFLLATDERGRLYVTQRQAPGANLGAVYNSASGTPLRLLGENVAPADEYLSMAASRSGEVYVGDATTGTILVMPPNQPYFKKELPWGASIIALSP